jgi:hypothetical protein
LRLGQTSWPRLSFLSGGNHDLVLPCSRQFMMEAALRTIMLGMLKVTRSGMLVGVLLSAAIATCGASADIGFARKGPFEGCLESAYDNWVKTQAEHMVNGDPRAQSVNDAAVAAWTVAVLNDCRKKGTAEAGSVDHFGRYMSRWREHVFDLASSIRKQGQSD